jgi:putative metallohydrolase (TIGR04338 family)
MSRDFQRAKVYAAENILARMYDRAAESGSPEVSLHGVTVTLPPEAKFGCVDSVQVYIDRVMAMPTVVAAFGGKSTPAVRHRQGTRAAHYCNNTIAIPTDRDGRWAMRELVVLHELAHHLAWGDRHGPRFVSSFITLLGLVLGPEIELLARMLFTDGGVQTIPPRVAWEKSAARTRKDPQ